MIFVLVTYVLSLFGSSSLSFTRADMRWFLGNGNHAESKAPEGDSYGCVLAQREMEKKRSPLV